MHQIFNKSLLAGFISLSIITGCKQAADKSEKTYSSGIPVTVSSPNIGEMITYMEFSATSAFLFKSVVKSPITGYIEGLNVNPGDMVIRNQNLFSVRTKEATAIQEDSLNSLLLFNGFLDVKAAIDGQISSIQHSKGDFISEGEPLCEVVIPESFVFIMDVPFESSNYAKLNSACEIVLPDNRVINGKIKSHLPSMSASSQTERFIIRMDKSENLPENMNVKIRIIRESVKTAVSLPKMCILTDETLQNFWVMKLINDSIAVKVIITTGISKGEFLQITKPEFNAADLFLSSGNYGLGDTAYVKVMKKIK